MITHIDGRVWIMCDRCYARSEAPTRTPSDGVHLCGDCVTQDREEAQRRAEHDDVPTVPLTGEWCGTPKLLRMFKKDR